MKTLVLQGFIPDHRESLAHILHLACHLEGDVCVHGEGNGTPLQYSCLENPMDGGAWWTTVHGVTKSWTRLSDFTFTFHFHALEKEMATHSSVLAWRIPGTGSLVGCRLWGRTESDATEVTWQQQQLVSTPPLCSPLPENPWPWLGRGLSLRPWVFLHLPLQSPGHLEDWPNASAKGSLRSLHCHFNLC